MDFLHKIGDHIESRVDGLFGGERHSHTHDGHDCAASHADEHNTNRFQSFAAPSTGHSRWFVDGCSYFWAVSEALEQAREYVYILDWWLSPELYLRRPPARNEQYRLDRMLQAAAERGVQVRVILYKEVPQALTLNSAHSKHALEALHPNIRVFRHPDHLPSGYDLKGDFESAFQNLSLRTFDLAKLGKDTLRTLYGTSDDIVLYWAHHEKLCVVDGRVAFMGGLDMCFGRWDTNSHPIADAHPENLDTIIFPGQDYNNARVYDFEDVDKWENNKLDRTRFSRMGWSDISISLHGPIVGSLLDHFVDRWNYIYEGKYTSRDGYAKLELPTLPASFMRHYVPDRLLAGGEQVFDGGQRMIGGLQHHFRHGMGHFFDGGGGGGDGEEHNGPPPPRQEDPPLHIQLTRSCSPWSAGHKVEHSIANAYIEAITNAEHFVYIENQFFITATSDEQHPVGNKIGRAIVQRILRAHAEGDAAFHIIVCMPAVPAFSGDLHADGALGTRAIMEFQYASISRGKHSIYGALQAGGVDDPTHYLRFYNLRNYDRINTAPRVMARAEQQSGVSYEDARREFDDAVETGYDGYARDQGTEGRLGDQYRRYQAAAADVRDDPAVVATADSVSASYMANGPPLEGVPWADGDGDTGDDGDTERAAFVSEELYIHSKVLIADDRLVICGSANLNDRSQLGSHDSEIAVVIEDPDHPVPSAMAGQPWTASAFAASLRRQLFRKHLGLLPDQPCDRPTRGHYDWDSENDRLVADPLSDDFRRLWTGTAATNTAAFDDVFHCVPTDRVRNWNDYESYFSQYFVIPGGDDDKDKKDKKDGKDGKDKKDDAGKVDYGHVVPSFPGGGAEVKARLAQVRGSLVEMPLQFLVDVKDLAKEGLSLNSLTDELYT